MVINQNMDNQKALWTWTSWLWLVSKHNALFLEQTPTDFNYILLTDPCFKKSSRHVSL